MQQIEIERKYLILFPDVDAMRELPGFSKSNITQIYLNSQTGVTHRVRSRTTDGVTVYTENTKIRIDKISCIETENEISEDRFMTLRENIRVGSHPLTKTRYLFSYMERTIEIDVYPQWKNAAVMEIELPDKNTIPHIPDFIKIIREVTGEAEYSNSNMSHRFPKEPHL